MKKLLLLVFSLVLIGMMLTACGTKKVQIPVDDIYASISEKVEFPPLMDVNQEEIKTLYGLDSDIFEEFIVKRSMLKIRAHEIAIIKVTDLTNVEKVKQAMEIRRQQIVSEFETYLQDQYEIAIDGKIDSNGKYIIFIISEQANEIVNTFNSFF